MNMPNNVKSPYEQMDKRLHQLTWRMKEMNEVGDVQKRKEEKADPLAQN